MIDGINCNIFRDVLHRSFFFFRKFVSVSIILMLCSCIQPMPSPQQITDSSEEPSYAQTDTETTSLTPTNTIPASLRISTTAPVIADLISATPEATLSLVSPSSSPISPGGRYCSGNAVLLDIPDRDEDEIAPEEGWCGETSIQMALEYFGKKITQQEINLAGKPKQPDLWEEDINVALDSLNVKYAAWDEYRWDVDGFLTWIGGQLKAGYPVLLGVKIYPDQEPDWEVDHFVLVVGCDKDGLTINTNNAGEGQIHVTYTELTTNFEDSYSIINRQKYLFGRAIQGVY